MGVVGMTETWGLTQIMQSWIQIGEACLDRFSDVVDVSQPMVDHWTWWQSPTVLSNSQNFTDQNDVVVDKIILQENQINE